ncbi:hypothetical protein IQ268_14160 [Oculatella sp. LEGE 06141]|uniref:hypothetical protein n=1 Tax=Oculatella sp. LEGE 06141 TaxID=1828648 RepID=UPI001882635B|nr:hypothetical protein [Oculatella sp. LEGE 06141]MBE9179709.1 hypothetical protein [Oculatella sp. LEGE 06141]
MPESVLVVLILTIIIFIVSVLAKGVVRLIGFGLIAILALTMLPRLRTGIADFINPNAAIQQGYGPGTTNSNSAQNSDRVVQPFGRSGTTSPTATPAPGQSQPGRIPPPSNGSGNGSGTGQTDSVPAVGAFW